MRIPRYVLLVVLASTASSIATAVVVTSIMPAGATDTTNFGVQQVRASISQLTRGRRNLA